MKRTDLEKNKGLKIRGQMQQAAIPGRFAQGASALPDRKEQRKLDQAAGLVPFAVKLHGDLVRQLREQADAEGLSLQELTDRLIRAGLVARMPVADDKIKTAPAQAVAVKKAAAKKVTVEKAAAKKVAAKKEPAKKAASKSAAPVKKAVAKKAPAKKLVKPKA